MSHQTLRVRCNFAQGDYIDGKIDNFVYGFEAEGEKEYVKCVVSDEYNEEVEKLKEELGVEGGVFLFFNDETASQ